MLGFDNELDRIEFMIALTERANSNGSLDNQLERLMLDYLSELTGVSKEDILLDKPVEKAKPKEDVCEDSLQSESWDFLSDAEGTLPTSSLKYVESNKSQKGH